MSRKLVWLVLAAALLVGGCSTGGERPTQSPSAAPVEFPAQQIAFGRFDNDDHTVGEILIENSDGSQERKLITPPAGSVDETPDWSPDGSHLIFERWTPQSEQIFVAAADGSNAHAVTGIAPATAGSVDASAGRDEHPVYSPDGSKIAFVRLRGDTQDNEPQHADVWIMNADGSSASNVTRLAAYAGEMGGVGWSPDGKNLVYSVYNDTPGAVFHGGALFTVRQDGTHKHRLTPWKLDAGGVPEWSSVTNLIAFRAVTDIEPGFGNVYTVRPDGSDLRQVTRLKKTPISGKVSISADGKWYLFAKGEQKQLFAQGDDSGSLRPVGTSSFYDSAPDWGPAP